MSIYIFSGVMLGLSIVLLALCQNLINKVEVLKKELTNALEKD